MTLDDYQKKAITFDHMKGDKDITSLDFMAKVLGIVGESGEFADKVKKLYRNNGGTMSEDERKELLKELGDILWYISVTAHYLGADFESIATNNLAKLQDRLDRNVIASKGDNR